MNNEYSERYARELQYTTADWGALEDDAAANLAFQLEGELKAEVEDNLGSLEQATELIEYLLESLDAPTSLQVIVSERFHEILKPQG